jgi:hypothetical protein
MVAFYVDLEVFAEHTLQTSFPKYYMLMWLIHMVKYGP